MGKNKGGGGGQEELIGKKAAAKPSGLSVATVWSTDEKEKDQGGWSTAGKKKPAQNKQGGYSSAAAAPAPKPKAAVPKAQPVVRTGPVVGGDAVLPSKKAKKDVWGGPPKAPTAPQQKKQQPPKQQAAPVEEDDDDAGWSTVAKAPKTVKAKQPQKSDKQLAHEARLAKQAQVQLQNQGVVGAAVVESEAEKKKAEKEAKKRMKEMEKLRLEKQAKEAQKAAEEASFTKVSKGPKAVKAKQGIEAFGEKTAWATLEKKQPQHKKLPKAQQARTVDAVSDAERQAILKKHMDSLINKPPPAEVDFRVLVQDKWYPIRQLLATNDFAHASKMVQAQAQKGKALGGFFIASADEKHWSNDNTVDDMWMAMGYITGLTKLFKNVGEKVSVTITPYWAKQKGSDASCSITINKPTLQEGCHGTMTLKHEQKHPVPLQELTVSIYEFTDAVLAECEFLSTFLDKTERAMDEVAETKKYKAGPNADKLKAIRGTLPQKFDNVVQELSWAYDEFKERYPAPQQ